MFEIVWLEPLSDAYIHSAVPHREDTWELSAFHTLFIYTLPHYVHHGEEENLLTAVDGGSSYCKAIGKFFKTSGLI